MPRWWPFSFATLSSPNKLTSDAAAPAEDVSEDESTGTSIPYDEPKDIGGSKKEEKKEEKEEQGKGEEKEEKEEEEDEDDGDDDELYTVEKILGHEFGRGNKLFLLVKWNGYDNPEDQTLEPEENLLDGAREIVEEYYSQIGGRPEPPKKRKSTGGRGTAQKQNTKRQRKPKAAAEKDDQNGNPPDWVPRSKSWENEVVDVDTIQNDRETSTLFAYLHWTNGKKSKVPIETCYEKCPMKMLKFYEKHLVFKDGAGPED